MAENAPTNEFYWDNIFIKVEDRLFCVPRCEFVQSSEVFADMFFLPSGPGMNAEGQNKEHPIVLEGYKKDEFCCLLKVMYPTARSLISGTTLGLCLGKEEWVSVLKLSTIWNMENIRKYAIHKLSTDFVLSPIEKIQLARAHKVAAWMGEGVTGLVNSNPGLTLNELATLGWETAAQILWIRDNSPHSGSLLPANTLRFTRDDVKCGYCSSSSSLINYSNCHSCGQTMPADAELTAPGPGTISETGDHLIRFSTIQCSHIHCRRAIFTSAIYCPNPSCGQYLGTGHNVRVTPKKGLDKLIEETFGEEIRNYEDA